MCLSRVHVIFEERVWRVAKLGELFKGPYDTKEEAVDVARLLALLCEPSEVVVHGPAGNVESHIFYG